VRVKRSDTIRRRKKKEFPNLKIGQKILDKRKWGKKGIERMRGMLLVSF
jgi:hypothetical protein